MQVRTGKRNAQQQGVVELFEIVSVVGKEERFEEYNKSRQSRPNSKVGLKKRMIERRMRG